MDFLYNIRDAIVAYLKISSNDVALNPVDTGQPKISNISEVLNNLTERVKRIEITLEDRMLSNKQLLITEDNYGRY